MGQSYVNLSFYRFFRLEDRRGPLAALRARLRAELRDWDLKGTLLLAPEGVNAMVSGTPELIARFRDYAAREFELPASAFKEGACDAHSFNRLLIKVKREIITIGNPAVRPDLRTGRRLAPRELKRWLDEGRSLVLLDTRNDYEISIGTFRGARDLGLQTSRDFSAKARAAADSLRGKTVVAFCTGGIRCEKASAELLDLGVEDVYQLEGGILRYFEENGAAHYDGTCFVFDWRLAVDGELRAVARADDPSVPFGRHR